MILSEQSERETFDIRGFYMESLDKKSKSQLIEEIETLRKKIAGLEKSAEQTNIDTLGQNEEYFRLLYERTPVGYQCLNEEGKLIEVNPTWLALLGYRRNAVIGRWFGDFLAPDYVAQFKKNFPRFKATGEIQGVQYEMIKKDGTPIFVEIDGMISYKEDGSFQQTHCILRDITERKRMEEELKESERKYRLIAKKTNDLISIHTFSTKLSYTYVSPSIKTIAGYEPEELLGRSAFDFIHPEDKKFYLPQLMKYIGYKLKNLITEKEDTFTETVEFRYRQKSGEWIYLESVGNIAEGRLLFISRDITKRKRVEKELKESEEKYRLMVESSGDGVVVSQKDKFIFVNDAFAKMLGYDKDDLIHRNYEEVYTETAVNKLKERERQRGKGQKVSNRYETVFKKRDGTEIDVEAHIAIIEYKGDKATFAVIRDITKQKEIIKALQRSVEQTSGLKDFIPICAGCNKICDDEKEGKPWVSPPEYMAKRLPDIKFSHGMCPDCMAKWYPDFVNVKNIGKPDKDQ
ncbi:MAG TPA: hypothetical protein DHW42_00320 [Candidatus Marinimicrobia bacterium]|nr:hypothetical protein [Candidatus Neomarinimicrobiota bacterium]